MRVIPIEESVTIDHRVATYDELRNLIEQAGDQIAVFDCICRTNPAPLHPGASSAWGFVIMPKSL